MAGTSAARLPQLRRQDLGSQRSGANAAAHCARVAGSSGVTRCGRSCCEGGIIMRHSVIFLFDVDNTLLDNDRVSADLKRHLEKEVGHERQQRYWAFFEELRAELGYAHYLGALHRYRSEYPRDPHLLTVADCLVAELSARGYQHQPNWGTRGLRLAGLACSC